MEKILKELIQIAALIVVIAFFVFAIYEMANDNINSQLIMGMIASTAIILLVGSISRKEKEVI